MWMIDGSLAKQLERLHFEPSRIIEPNRKGVERGRSNERALLSRIFPGRNAGHPSRAARARTLDGPGSKPRRPNQMSQRKLIVVLGVIAITALCAGVSEASLSRVEGMGLTPAPYLSQFTDDYVNIFYYPTSVVRQNNLVLAEVGNNPSGDVDPVAFDDQSVTIIKNFSNFGAIAFDMKQNSLHSLTPGLSDALTHEQLDLIWGKGFSNLDLAVRLDATNSSFEYNDNAAPTHVEAHGSGFNPFDPYPFGLTFLPDAIRLGLFGSGPIEINTWGITPSVALHLSNDNRVEAALTFRKYSLDRQRTDAGVAGEKWEDDASL